MTTTAPRSASARVVRPLCRAVLVFVALEAILVVIFRMKWRPGIDAIRRFNKAVLNPPMLLMAGSKHWYASVIHHRGRTSGKPYATPVVIQEAGGRLYIPLPYGTRVDWCANVLVAGGCAVQHKGKRFETTAPAIIPFAKAAPMFPRRSRRTFGLYGVESFLGLEITA